MGTMETDQVEELVRRHDQFQFEVKLEYDLNKDNKEDRYRVETYFFLPNNLDVNESTYDREKFYRDLLLYIRFKTPDFSLRALIDPDNARSPLAKIRAKSGTFLQTPTTAVAESLEYEIKLFGCVLKSALRDRIHAVEKLLRRGGAAARLESECVPLLRNYAREAREAVVRFRSFRDRLKSPPAPKDLASAFAFTDEYVSLLVESRTHRLLQLLYRLEPAPILEPVARELAGMIEEETAYRRAADYPSLVTEDEDNEVFLFRLSVLKKFVSSILYLSVKTVETGRAATEAALAAGAGIAMLFATAVAFYYQKVYGTLSLTFFAVLVFSYMLKDRLKAISQRYILKKFAASAFDQSTKIYDQFNGEEIGECREGFRFVSEREVDPVALRLRNRDHITEIENDWRSERVIRYMKEIALNSSDLAKNQSRKSAVTDIARFSVGSFLRKMDEPSGELYILKDGKSRMVHGTRVYHVNMVIKFTSDKQTRYERIRLVLTRQGIKRIEPVSSEILSSGARP